MNNVMGIYQTTSSGGSSPSGGSVTEEITVSATDVSNGYITVPVITLNATTTKVVRGGSIQDNSQYSLNTPVAGDITFTLELVENEVIKVFN